MKITPTMASLWASFEAQMITPDETIGRDQRDLLRMAFYGGAHALLATLEAGQDPRKLLAEFENFRRELQLK